MMTKSTKMIFHFLAAMMIFSVPCYAVELLRNGNAKDGLNGWANPEGVWMTSDFYDRRVSADGKHFFFPRGFKGKDGVSTRIYQDVSVKGYEGMTAILSAYNRTWDDGHKDESLIMLEFFDSDGRLLDKDSAHGLQKSDWHKLSVSRKIPGGAARARVSLLSVYHVGSESDSYFHSVSLTVGGTALNTLTHNAEAMMIIYLVKGDRIRTGTLIGGRPSADVKYSSSNSSIASVTSKGTITAHKRGSAVITASSGGKDIKIMIEVEE